MWTACAVPSGSGCSTTTGFGAWRASTRARCSGSEKNAPEIIRGQLAFGLGGEAAHKGVKPLTAFFISTLMQHVLSRPDFLAYEAISEHGLNLPMRLVRLMRPWMVAWTIRSQEALDHTRGKYDIAIFEGFVPPAKRS